MAMNKVIPGTIICHENLTPQACMVRVELAREKGYLIVEDVNDPRYLEYMKWSETNPPPQVHPALVKQPDRGEVGLGSAFMLGLVLVGIVSAFKYFLRRRRESEQEYNPVYQLNPWEDERLFPASDEWPDMRRVYPMDQMGVSPHDPTQGTRRASPAAGRDGRAEPPSVKGTQSPHPLSHPYSTPPPTPLSHYAVELAPALPNPILKLLPFDPKEQIQLFEYESFRELFKYYPDMKRDDAILVIWAKKKGGNNPGYDAAKTRFQEFKGNMQAADNEWK